MLLRPPDLGMYATELLKCSSFAFSICTAASLTVERSVVNSRSQACKSRTDAVKRSQDVRPSSEGDGGMQDTPAAATVGPHV